MKGWFKEGGGLKPIPESLRSGKYRDYCEAFVLGHICSYTLGLVLQHI